LQEGKSIETRGCAIFLQPWVQHRYLLMDQILMMYWY